MFRLRIILDLSFSCILCLGAVENVRAQTLAANTWVSGVGDDGNNCSRQQPCKTFAGALAKTVMFGQINCVDRGDFAALAITKSVTIDCQWEAASIGYSGNSGVTIDFDQFPVGDYQKSVRLRGLSIEGEGQVMTGVHIKGIASLNSAVFVEDCVIDGMKADNAVPGSGRGIFDERSGGGELYVMNTIIQNNADAGIAAGPTTGGKTIELSLNNTLVQNSKFGLYIVAGVEAMVSNSVFSGNSDSGIQAEAGSTLVIDESVSSGNGGALTVNGSAAVRLSNSDVVFNRAGISSTVNSFSNNRVSSNPAGSPLSMIGTSSVPTGQQ